MSYICSIKLKTVINMDALEFLKENLGKFFMFEGERCRLVGTEQEPYKFLVIERKNGWLARPVSFKQMWNGEVNRAWYVQKEQLIPIGDIPVRQFAEDNSGRYYTFKGVRVRVVGYRSNSHVIITYRKGWRNLDPEDNFTCKTRATRFLYVYVGSLKEIPLW